MISDISRLQEAAKKAAARGVSFTRFMDPSVISDALKAGRETGVKTVFFGGYDGAERVVAAFFADTDTVGADSGEYGKLPWPVKALSVKWDKRFGSVAHRDLLGAVMGLGIAREMTGDMLIGDGEAVMFVIDISAEFILLNLNSAGRVKVSVSEADVTLTNLPEENGEAARVVVSSMRADGVIAAAFGLSRSAAVELSESGRVKRNFIQSVKPDATVTQGDMLSVRGYGRIRIEQVEKTRKDRLALGIIIYR